MSHRFFKYQSSDGKYDREQGGNPIPETLNRNNTEVPKYGNDEWQQPGDYRQLHRDPAEIYIFTVGTTE